MQTPLICHLWRKLLFDTRVLLHYLKDSRNLGILSLGRLTAGKDWKHIWSRLKENVLKKNSFTKKDYVNTQRYIGSLKKNEYVQRMKNYIQHGRITTFKHCERVAAMSYYINRRFKLHADNKVMLKAAMLHDFYLYDWHDKDNGEHNWHGYIHATKAMNNARKFLNFGRHEQQVIYSHMWPLNITRVPRSKEAWIVCLADKYISIRETLFERKKK